MSLAQTNEPAPMKPLRLWPGVVVVALQWLTWLVVPIVAPAAAMFAVFGAFGLGLVVAVWWLFFSRAPWAERVGAIALMVGAIVATKWIVHPSVAGAGMGFLLYVYAVPVLSLALVASAVVTRRMSGGLRRATMTGAIILACGVFTVLRTGGITGEGGSDFHLRWTKTPEEQLLAHSSHEPAAPSASAAAKANADWPGFRGPERDSIVRGVRIETNWSGSKPVELWRRPIGPGWSSFAVHGDVLYTEEQRGDDELVSCYNLASGAPVWSHRDAARFYESNGGPGPRGTPTVSNGRVYAFGATGILNALDARDGSAVWSRNAASDTKRKIPGWGFASSPLVVGDEVIVATAGTLAAYDLGSGKLRWTGPVGLGGYSSPHLAMIGGVSQILFLNTEGALSVAPADGALLWKHEWPGDGIVQPSVITGSHVLLGSGSGLGGKVGLRRVAVAHGPGGWSVEERWTSIGLKPYYNDFVIHKDHAFGFDGSMLACIDLADGKRKWKGGRYGYGQLIVLSDQDLLLVLSEEGELALVKATSDQFSEITRFPAIKGKTWNHPVLVGDVLLVRNDQEMAAFRLALAGR